METPLQETTEVLLKEVKLSKRWTFWENFEMRGKKKKGDYSQLTKAVYSFDNIIEFWQFWNSYPGKEPSNIFFNGERLL